MIPYGAPILQDVQSDLLPPGLQPRGYHLVVARFEPENHVLQIVQGYTRSVATHPLVVVGAAPFAERYTDQIKAVADADPRIQMLGRVDDQDALDQLYGNALTYLHGHSVGGTNPSLLRAMGAGSHVIAFDVNFNQEVAGPDAQYFSDPADLAALLQQAEAEPAMTVAAGLALRKRAADRYRWDDVADKYEDLGRRLASRAPASQSSAVYLPGQRSVPAADVPLQVSQRDASARAQL
jgi:glycosyltransferase involved in cell wall biosynthesis